MLATKTDQTSMEQSRGPEMTDTLIYSINLQQRKQGYSMKKTEPFQ